ncbi:MAG: hypothetical protein ACOX39_04415 [Arcobacteraceae bacterium]|jgi:hypothetical protein
MFFSVSFFGVIKHKSAFLVGFVMVLKIELKNRKINKKQTGE